MQLQPFYVGFQKSIQVDLCGDILQKAGWSCSDPSSTLQLHLQPPDGQETSGFFENALYKDGMLWLEHSDFVPDLGALYAGESYTSTWFDVSAEQATPGTWSLYAAAVPDLMAQQDVALDLSMDINDFEPIQFEFLNVCKLIGWAQGTDEQIQTTSEISGEFSASELKLQTFDGFDSDEFIDFCEEMKWSVVLEYLSERSDISQEFLTAVDQQFAQNSVSELALEIELHAANQSISIEVDDKSQQEFREQIQGLDLHLIDMKLKAEWASKGVIKDSIISQTQACFNPLGQEGCSLPYQVVEAPKRQLPAMVAPMVTRNYCAQGQTGQIIDFCTLLNDAAQANGYSQPLCPLIDDVDALCIRISPADSSSCDDEFPFWMMAISYVPGQGSQRPSVQYTRIYTRSSDSGTSDQPTEFYDILDPSQSTNTHTAHGKYEMQSGLAVGSWIVSHANLMDSGGYCVESDGSHFVDQFELSIELDESSTDCGPSDPMTQICHDESNNPEIDFCLLANDNGIMCPPSQDTEYVSVFISTNAERTIMSSCDTQSIPFWQLVIDRRATRTIQYNRPQDFDTQPQKNANQGLFTVTAAMQGIYYVSFLTGTYLDTSSLTYTASDFYQNEFPDWPIVELQIENCQVQGGGGGNVSQSSDDSFQSYFYRCPVDSKVTPIFDICTLEQSLDSWTSCPPATGRICVRVTTETGSQYYYQINQNSDPSQMIGEEMGEGEIKVEFVYFAQPNGPTCADIFAPSQDPLIYYLYLEVEEDSACGSSYPYDISYLEQNYPSDPVQFAKHEVSAITTNAVERSFGLLHKFYTISKVRVWKHNDIGMSGFEVTWRHADSPYAFPPVTYMFGEETLMTDYTVIHVSSVLTGIRVHSGNVRGIFLEYLFHSSGQSSSPMYPDYDIDLHSSVIGFQVTFAESDDYHVCSKVKIITDSNSCEMQKADVPDWYTQHLGPFEFYDDRKFVDEPDFNLIPFEITGPVDGWAVEDMGCEQINYLTFENLGQYTDSTIVQVEQLDYSQVMMDNVLADEASLYESYLLDLGYPTLIIRDSLLANWLHLKLDFQTAAQQQAAFGSHYLSLVFKTRLSNGGNIHHYLFNDFTLSFKCSPADVANHFTALGAKCQDYDWCSNNYQSDELSISCPQFDNCIIRGDGTGDFDATGSPCPVEKSIFDQAKELFDSQFPRIQFVDAGQEEIIVIKMLSYAEYEDYKLVTNFGKARGFTEYSERSGEIVIAPDKDDIGDYTLEVTLTDGSQEYDRTMLLYVQGPTEALQSDTLSSSKSDSLESETEKESINEVKSESEDTADKELANEEEFLITEKVESIPEVKIVDKNSSSKTEEKEEVFDVEQVKKEILESTEECNEECLKAKVKALAEEQLQKAKAEIKKETKIQIGDLEIEMNLEKLTQATDETGEDQVSEVEEIMNQVEEMPVEVQMLVFDTILSENAAFKEKQREIQKLEAISQGFTPPEPEPPALAYQDVEPSGEFGLYFNADVAGLSFMETLNKGLGSRGKVSEGTRYLSSEDFDLSNFLTFEIQRGAEDSADSKDLGFTIASAGLENNLLKFELIFDDPLQVSIGLQNDILMTTIVDGSFFSSEANGLPIEAGTQIEQPLPKMLPGKAAVQALETTKQSIENATNTVVVAQIIITVVLALSLKSMWNLMNVIQVLAYVRFFSGWPAMMLEVFKYMDDAITLKPVSDPIFEYGQTQFEKANATLTDEGMKNMGVQDSTLMKSLGLFFVVILGLLFLVLIYYLVRSSKNEKSLAYKIKVKLEKKLFYSSFLRYMIVSNLKLNFTTWAFLISQWSFDSIKGGVQTVVQSAVIVFLCLWPLFIIAFMLKNQHRLHEPDFAQKWDTLYQGIHQDSKAALIYNAIFCLRRFYIVFVNMIFSPGFPGTDFGQHQYLFKQFAFIFIQTAYLLYVTDTRPHTVSVFNSLEFFNEGMIILMCYIMICYAGIGPISQILKSKVPFYISILITAAIVAANFGVMIKMTISKMKEKYKLRKLQAASKKAQEERSKLESSMSEKYPLNSPVKTPARTGLLEIQEESKEEESQEEEKEELQLESINSSIQKEDEEAQNLFNSHGASEPARRATVITPESNSKQEVRETQNKPKRKTIKRNRTQRMEEQPLNSVDLALAKTDEQPFVLPAHIREKIMNSASARMHAKQKYSVSKSAAESLKRVHTLFALNSKGEL